MLVYECNFIVMDIHTGNHNVYTFKSWCMSGSSRVLFSLQEFENNNNHHHVNI